jgi:hypothetical protein
MRTARSPRGRVLILLIFIGSHLPLVGCNDQSRTSGTMVQVSEEAKKHLEGRRDAYKAKKDAKAKARKDQSKRSSLP